MSKTKKLCLVYASTKYLLASLSPNPVSKVNFFLIAFTYKKMLINCFVVYFVINFFQAGNSFLFQNL